MRLTRGRDLLGLAGFAALCAAVSATGGAVTATSVSTWYQMLDKPVFNPPDWAFPVVWTALYVMIAVAGWRVWRRAPLAETRRALTVYALQLALNLAWSFLFFGLQWIGLALAEIVVLWLAIAANAVLFWRLDRWAGALLVPYLVWVGYATVLNAALWLLNAS
jgi:tryptophan-rich sensory protein